MRFIRMALVSFAALAVVSTAKADILLEPYIGYAMGQAKNEVSGTTQTYDNTNVMLGGRVGWQFLVAMLGLDYAMPMSGKYKGSGGGAGDFDWSGSQLWVYAGARLPLIRAYAGYSLMSTTELKDSSGTTKITGDGIKVGGSFTGFPLISINLEYIMNTAKKINSAGVDYDVPGSVFSKSTSDYVFLSVSAPLSF